ncbi:MAG TPA: hypothetical protein PK014_12865 [Thermoanaerobaculia bacterium]|nr:hypothetical protein [Thermoanaerobaculia bacterium]HUM30977.1 hypothetical protein [Thermoanaerobaculia bacterium]HXK69290.1 hypothetical protein [Thermoanaerobaculia bacterium]
MTSFLFSSVSNPLYIDSSSQKVPGTRNQIEITNSAYTLSDDTYLCALGVTGRGVEVIQTDPDELVLVSQAIQTGTSIIQFPEDGYYRLTSFVVSEDGQNWAEAYSYFRVDQGNVHTIPEQIYKNAVDDIFIADVKSKAKLHAHRDLEELKANGLQIAIENWPHDEINFPVENNLDLPIETEEEIYSEEFLNTAVSDPRYVDTVIVNPTKTYPCYTASISQTPSLPLFQNKQATIKFRAYNTFKKPFFGYTCRTIKNTVFYLYSRIWVTDICTNFTYLKTVRYRVVTDSTGTARVTIAYAPNGVYPNMDPPIIRLSGITSLGDVKVGECDTRTVSCDGPTGECAIPVYTLGSESQILLDANLRYDSIDFDLGCNYDTGLYLHQIDEWLTQSGKEEEWQVHGYYALDDDQVENPQSFIIFDHLRTISSFWQSKALPVAYTQFSACYCSKYADFNIPHFTMAVWAKDDQVPSPILAYGDKVGSYWTFTEPLSHEAGHLFQANMQGGFLWAGEGHQLCFAIDDSTTVFTEGFAHWFALYMDHSLNQPLYLQDNYFCYPYGDKNTDEVFNCSRCKSYLQCSQLDDSYDTAWKDELVVGSFLWDLFDQAFYSEVGNCFIDERQASNADPDPNTTVYRDQVSLSVGALRNWDPSGYHSLNDFLRDWLSPGMPLDGKKSQLDSLMKLNFLTPLPGQ